MLAAGIVLLMACRELPGATGRAAETTEAEPADLLIFVFDRSTSVRAHELEHARGLTRDRLRTLDFGDRIVALELLRHQLDEEPVRWSQRVPSREFADRTLPSDSVSKARFIRDVTEYVRAFGDPEDRDDIDGTDILSTLHLVASEIAAEPSARATLYLFSDMLQANRSLNLEGPAPGAGPSWIQEQDSLGALPDLRGLCVIVVGALEDSPRTRHARDFWKEYFHRTGAVLEDAHYTYRPVRLPEGGCAEPPRP